MTFKSAESASIIKAAEVIIYERHFADAELQHKLPNVIFLRRGVKSRHDTTQSQGDYARYPYRVIHSCRSNHHNIWFTPETAVINNKN